MGSVKHATVSDLIRANKFLKQAKDIKVAINFLTPDDIENPTILTHHDASYANLTNGRSQGGNIILLIDSYVNAAPVSWQSKYLQRVIKSMLGAETLFLADAAETSFWISSILAEIFHKDEALNQGGRNIECATDNRSLFEAVHSTTALAVKRLHVDNNQS